MQLPVCTMQALLQGVYVAIRKSDRWLLTMCFLCILTGFMCGALLRFKYPWSFCFLANDRLTVVSITISETTLHPVKQFLTTYINNMSQSSHCMSDIFWVPLHLPQINVHSVSVYIRLRLNYMCASVGVLQWWMHITFCSNRCMF